MPDPRRHSPAAERNRAAILTELLRRLPAQGRALEIASGSGQHVCHFAAALPGWQWQPTDTDPTALDSVAALTQDAGLCNVLPPQRLDLLSGPALDADAPPWLQTPLQLVYCANLLHIAPWAVCAAVMKLAAARLAAPGRLLLYGPFRVQGEPLQPGNAAFDADLRQRNPAWGLRWLHEVVAAAHGAGLVMLERVDMPANNLLLVFGLTDTSARWQVSFDNGRASFEAPASSSLLESGLAAGLDLPSACRNGSCRRCLVRLRSGVVQHTIEWPGLSPEEKAAGWVLPCVACPRSDLLIASDP